MLNTPNVGNGIKRQIIQTMSILVQNITNDTYFYYLFNEIISHIHSHSIIVTRSKNSWGPDCCVEGDTYSSNGLHNEERTDQQLSNNTYITTHHRPACVVRYYHYI